MNYLFPGVEGGTPAKAVTAIAVKTQPTKLSYFAGDTLDLTGLVVTLTYNDTSTEDVTYSAANFTAKGITASPANGTTLSVATHHDNPVTLTCNSKTADTDDLTVSSSVDDVAADKAALISSMIGSGNPTSAPSITRTLISLGVNGSTITWGNVVTPSGSAAATRSGSTLNLSFPTSNATRTSTIQATLTKGSVTDTVIFTITTGRTGTTGNRRYPWSIVEG